MPVAAFNGNADTARAVAQSTEVSLSQLSDAVAGFSDRTSTANEDCLQNNKAHKDLSTAAGHWWRGAQDLDAMRTSSLGRAHGILIGQSTSKGFESLTKSLDLLDTHLRLGSGGDDLLQAVKRVTDDDLLLAVSGGSTQTTKPSHPSVDPPDSVRRMESIREGLMLITSSINIITLIGKKGRLASSRSAQLGHGVSKLQDAVASLSKDKDD